jgi:hypothetical protein
MSDGYHGSMPSEVFKNLIMNANPSSRELKFEISRMNRYANAGLYRTSQDPNAPMEHIMGVTIGEFPERTVVKGDGSIEALGWREALTTLIQDGIITPNEDVKMWLGIQGVAFALAHRKSMGIVASI